MARLGDTNRISVPIEDIPEDMQNAVVAAEDRRFYEHSGFDVGASPGPCGPTSPPAPRRVGRRSPSSTPRTPTSPRTRPTSASSRSWCSSLKLETALSKDEILERYLNTIYFGRGAYGVETAAEAYFGVGLGADPGAVRGPRRDHQRAREVQPGHQHGEPRAALRLRPQRDVRGGLHHRRGARRRPGQLPGDQEAQEEREVRRADRVPDPLGPGRAGHARASPRRRSRAVACGS